MRELSNFAEGQPIVENYVCGEEGCNSELIIMWGSRWGISSYVAVCDKNKEHNAIKPRVTAMMVMRQNPNTGIENIPIDADRMRRMIKILSVKYPDVLCDFPTAALFVMQCKQLGLEPLISPAEAVPILFTDGKTHKKTLAMIISSDGWMSLAARAEPERWAGPPKLTRVLDKALCKALTNDENAIIFEASGKTKESWDPKPVPTEASYGWVKSSEMACFPNLPAGQYPGNQACRRAIKRWVRDNFPACRQKMMGKTSAFMEKSEGIKAAEDIVDGEYVIIEAPSKDEKTSTADMSEAHGPSERIGDEVFESKRGAEKPADVPPGDPPIAEPKALRNTGDLMKAANERWGLTPSEVEKILGKPKTQFGDLWDEWKALKKKQEGT